jgi:lysophospholipase L1-like esterase
MKRTLILCFGLVLVWGVKAQHPSYKFDFGTDVSKKGYIAVNPTNQYSEEKGYGFHRVEGLRAVIRNGKDVRADFITSSKPFSFSVKLPEGNYDVRLLLGDPKGISATTVRAECRRLMLENIRTKKGELKEVSFTVHVRDSLIRDPGGHVQTRVRLKPREKNYLHWDHMLTLEFSDSIPKIASLEISPNQSATTIFLAGNSTVVDQDHDPWASWGQIFPRFLKASEVVVANYAESGESLHSFKGARRLDKIWSMSKPGDYLFIEFAHNDQKPGGNHLDPFTTYKQTLLEWIKEARSRKMVPVLVTSMHRRNFDSAGHIVNTLGDYPEAMRQSAKENQVPIIDLNAMSGKLFNALGPDGSLKAFVHFPPNHFPGQTEALKDNTHFSTYGAYLLASCVVSDIRKQGLPLAKFIRKEVADFDPAIPFPFSGFYWPLSDLQTAKIPDGN